MAAVRRSSWADALVRLFFHTLGVVRVRFFFFGAKDSRNSLADEDGARDSKMPRTGIEI